MIMGNSTSVSLDSTMAVIAEDGSGSYLAEIVSYYRLFNRGIIGSNIASDTTSWHQETVSLGDAYLEEYDYSEFAEDALRVTREARQRLDPILPGEVDPWRITIEPVCGNSIFHVGNGNDQPIVVSYVVGNQSEVVELGALSSIYIDVVPSDDLLKLFHNNELLV